MVCDIALRANELVVIAIGRHFPYRPSLLSKREIAQTSDFSFRNVIVDSCVVIARPYGLTRPLTFKERLLSLA
jgi:hypothetical protein